MSIWYEGGRIIFPQPFQVLAEILCNTRQITKRKTNRSLLTYVPHIYLERYPGDGLGHHLEYHLELKTKESCWGRGGEGQEVSYGRLPGKAVVRLIIQIQLGTLSSNKFLVIQNHPSLPGTDRQTPQHVEVSLINPNVSNKRVTSAQFSEFLLCLVFLRNNLLKMILMLLERKNNFSSTLLVY